jgi:NADH-quinone oxidoreductase subunit L
MVLPMAVLAVASILAGVLVNPPVDLGPVEKHAFGTYLADNEAVFPTHEAEIEAGAEPEFNLAIAIASSALAVVGIGAAYALYGRGGVAVSLPSVLQPVHTLLARKYYFDELYEDLIVRKLFYRRFNAAIEWIDTSWIDGMNIRISVWTGHAGRAMTHLQNGQVQAYGVAIFLGVIVTLAVYFVWGG